MVLRTQAAGNDGAGKLLEFPLTAADAGPDTGPSEVLDEANRDRGFAELAQVAGYSCGCGSKVGAEPD